MPQKPRFELIDGDIEGGQRVLYVYRDTGSGRADGSFLKKYSDKVTFEDIARDVGGGAFILIEQGGGKPFRQRRVIIPHEKAQEAEVMIYNEDGDLLKRMERMIQLKAAANMLKPEMDMITTLKTVLELVNTSKGQTPTGSDLFDTFREGIDFAGELSGVPSSPEAAIAQAALRLADKEPAPTQTNAVPPVVARIAAALSKRVKILSAQVAELRSIKQDIEAIKTALARRTEPAGAVVEQPEDTRKEEIVMNAVIQFTDMLAEHMPEQPEQFNVFLQLAEAKIPNLKTALRAIDAETRASLLREFLEQVERAELFDMYSAQIELYAAQTSGK